MTYVMSDIHGCYELYKKMLDLIDLTPDDTLYILGDLTDRGDENMAVVLDVMNRDNVKVIRGNHDDMAADFFGRHPDKPGEDELIAEENARAWYHNGRDKTFEEFYSMDKEEREKVAEFFCGLPLREIITVNGRKYHLSHSVPEKEMMSPGEPVWEFYYLWGEPDFNEKYFDDVTLVVGHTPTLYTPGVNKGRIYKGPNIIDVDCGAVFFGTLGCLRLDDGEEFYVNDDEKEAD